MTILEKMPDTAAARRAMIDSQLRVSGVNDPAIIAAFAAVPRDEFVPAAVKAAAYVDRAVALADGHMLAAPLFYGRMLTEAGLGPQDTVLVVSPCGYLAALVEALGCPVERMDPAQAAAARKSTARASVILIDGAIEQLPAGLASRLADGGRIVTGLAERGVTRLATGTRTAGDVALLPLAEMGIPVLAEFAAPRRWSF